MPFQRFHVISLSFSSHPAESPLGGHQRHPREMLGRTSPGDRRGAPFMPSAQAAAQIFWKENGPSWISPKIHSLSWNARRLLRRENESIPSCQHLMPSSSSVSIRRWIPVSTCAVCRHMSKYCAGSITSDSNSASPEVDAPALTSASTSPSSSIFIPASASIPVFTPLLFREGAGGYVVAIVRSSV